MKLNKLTTVKLLVVSSDSSVLHPLWSIGESNGWQLEMAANAWEAMDKIQSGITLDLLLLDLPPENGEAMHTVRWLRRQRPALPVILIGHAGDSARRQESLRLGARDYLMRPLDGGQLEAAIQQNLSRGCEPVETDITSDDVELIGNGRFFIGISSFMRKLRTQAAMLAEADVPVLILGEDGSGKENVARLIHHLSIRSGFDCAKVACSALPEDLLEREILGYERKNATAPAQSKSGKLESCTKGTIILDEIAEMPLGLQSALVEVVQSKRFTRPGSSSFIDADVRVLATSSRDLERAVYEDRFNEDLYNSLAAYTIHLPSLRERREEIPFLARHFMHRLSAQYGLPPREYSPAILESWQAYSWPGNLRELERSVKRYLMVGDKELTFDKTQSDATDVAPSAAAARPRSINQPVALPVLPTPPVSESNSLRSLIKSVKSEAERNAIAMALEKTGWNRKAAARLLKVSYRTVLYKIEQYKMTAHDSSTRSAGNGNRIKPASVGTAEDTDPEKVANL